MNDEPMVMRLLIRAILTQAGPEERASMVRFLEGRRRGADPASDSFSNKQAKAFNEAVEDAIFIIKSGGITP